MGTGARARKPQAPATLGQHHGAVAADGEALELCPPVRIGPLGKRLFGSVRVPHLATPVRAVGNEKLGPLLPKERTAVALVIESGAVVPVGLPDSHEPRRADQYSGAVRAERDTLDVLERQRWAGLSGAIPLPEPDLVVTCGQE